MPPLVHDRLDFSEKFLSCGEGLVEEDLYRSNIRTHRYLVEKIVSFPVSLRFSRKKNRVALEGSTTLFSKHVPGGRDMFIYGQYAYEKGDISP